MISGNVPVVIKMRIFKSFENGQETSIIEQVFDAEDLKEQLGAYDFWQVEMYARCSDNDLRAHCNVFSEFAKKFSGLIELAPTTLD